MTCAPEVEPEVNHRDSQTSEMFDTPSHVKEAFHVRNELKQLRTGRGVSQGQLPPP